MHKLHKKALVLNRRGVFNASLFLLMLIVSSTAKSEGNPLQVLSGASGVPIQGPWDAAGSIAAIQKMYQTMVVQLQELKAQSKFLSDVNKVAKESLRQYDAVNNVSLAAIKKQVLDDKESLTQLDNMNGLSDREKLETLSKELDRRIKSPTTSEVERQRLLDRLALAQTLKRLENLEEATNQNLSQSAGALTEREALHLTSQSAAILAKLQLLEDKRRYQEFIARGNDNKAQQTFSSPSAVLDKIGAHEMSTGNGSR